jgi:hypothetical protein
LCTYAIPIVIHDPNTDPTIPGTPGTPPPLTNCIPEVDAGLPDSMAELQALHDSIVNGGPPTGAAANPPTSGSCAAEDPSIAAIGIDPKSSRGCKIADQQPGNCANDAQCQGKFGAGYYCRAVPNSFSCTPPDAGTPQRAGCLGSQQCVKITCPADQPPCDEIDICDPGTDLHSSLDPSAQLDAGSFQPQSLFGGTLPDAGSAGQYVDQPDGSGTQHTWCAMTPQAPIATAKQAPGGFKGTSGGGGKIQFEFDPDLIFDVDTSPIALGETTHTIHAAAKLGAKVTVNNFLTANFSQSILDASIGLQAQRCDLDDTKDTQISVFGLDILPFDTLGIPKINSTDPNSCTSTTDTSVACSLYKASRACQGAVNQYSEFANRSKKAFRDAQQLLSQYYAAKKNGGALTTDLCHQLGVDSANVPGFPGGNQCSTAETPEATINRFIDYYQAPGSGQVSQLRQAAMGLAAQSQAVAAMFSGPNPISLQFANFSGEESQTIVNVPFLIGPVPMVLQIDIFAQYGVTGNFVLDLKYPLNLDSGPGGDPKQVAHVEADVVPFAGAGLDAFVGAGFDLGVISATIGLEGAVTLADLKAPIFAGAGFDVAVTADNRPLPDDIQPPVAAASDAFQFVGGAKSFKFFVTYDYGAGVDIDHVLSGEINGRLRISFAFFSRTWRKRVIHFDGWHAHFDLIHGGSDPSVATSKLTVPNTDKTDRDTTNVSNGQNALGLSEAQVPLMQLGRLTVPSTPTPGSVQFDATKVQSLFYDKQCCFKTGEVCSTSGTGTGGCCPGETCKGSNAPPPDGGPDLAIGTCQCDDTGVICTASTQCCGFDTGTVVCGSQHACRQCIGKGLACDSPLDCCNQDCNFGRCAPPPG